MFSILKKSYIMWVTPKSSRTNFYLNCYLIVVLKIINYLNEMDNNCLYIYDYLQI